MSGLYSVFGPLLRLLPPEIAHGAAILALERGWVPSAPVVEDDRLAMSLWGLDFPHPVGLAAGFDKDGRVANPMLDQGFSFVEVGSVTPLPQVGNPRPRLFRLPIAGGVINRMGFNSAGMEVVAERLEGCPRRGILGINLGANKDSDDRVADYVEGARRFAPLADYLVVNVSSPNTPGLRALQGREPLAALLAAVRDAAPDRTLLLKVAPDLTLDDLSDIAMIGMDGAVDGIIATNTTIERPPDLRGFHKRQAGGLSGRPLMRSSTQILSDLYDFTAGRLPLVGVGGIFDAWDAYAKIRAGASLVQLYTGLIYRGPGLVMDIRRDLADLVARDGFSSIVEAVGADHR